MFPSEFEYHRAASVKEALGLIQQYGDEAKLLSGGHSLLPILKLRLAQPRHLVDIARIAELGQIAEQGGRISVGAAVRHHQVHTSDLLRGKLGLLAECAGHIGDVQVRNRGTIGGSLAHSDPAADYPAAVLALEGEVRLESAAGARAVKAEDFFLDLMTTALKPGEILTAVSFAPLPAATGFAYFKHRQPASGFAMVGVAACLTIDPGGKCRGARVGMTGLGAKAFRAKAVENALNGKAPETKVIAEAAAHAADGIDPLSDIHASADFRAELARVYTRRALESAVARARR
jgi:aerobic carbon-monoxide dehydrogenase medium subunit